MPARCHDVTAWQSTFFSRVFFITAAPIGSIVITEALQHCRGVGPIRLAQLRNAGLRTWHDVVTAPELVPVSLRNHVLEESLRSLQALQEDNIRYFIDHLSPQDKWRVLAQYLDRSSFFDIETTGLGYDDTITVIVCWHRNQLHTFVEHENLDDFLDLLDEMDLLVSFNGSSFDVPRLLDGFHIPDLPCPHLDLRWPCHYQGLSGGLKQVTSQLGIDRPADLRDADGELAVRLWSMWLHQQDATARDQLIRYCAADVLLLRPLAERLAGSPMNSVDQLWNDLPTAAPAVSIGGSLEERKQFLSGKYGSASPAVLRTRRRPTG